MYISVDSNGFFCGICEQAIDPVESEKKSKESILTDSVFKSKINEYNRLNDLSSRQKNPNGKLMSEISRIKSECDNIIKSHISKNISYTKPAPIGYRAVNVDMDEKEVIEFISKKQKHKRVKFENGSLVYVNDFTKCVFYEKENDTWYKRIIKNVGDVPDDNWIIAKDLSPEQFAEISLQQKTDEEKDKIKERDAFNNFLSRMFKESPEYLELKNGKM
jgi:hypothetical protein